MDYTTSDISGSSTVIKQSREPIPDPRHILPQIVIYIHGISGYITSSSVWGNRRKAGFTPRVVTCQWGVEYH